MKGRAKSKCLTSSLSPGGNFYSRALKTEVIIPPPHRCGSCGYKQVMCNVAGLHRKYIYMYCKSPEISLKTMGTFS